MTIFIDGYNLIFAAEKRLGGFDMRRTEAAREKLLGLLAKYNALRKDRIVVFFDGGPEAAHLPRRQWVHGMEAVFSEARSDADADIKNAVSHDDNPRDIRVVTSDAAIRKFVKRYGAQVTRAFDFLGEVQEAFRENEVPEDEPIEKYDGPSKDEVDYWLGFFGEDEEEAE